MADPVDKNAMLHDLLARGVPWPIAREAVSSTALDRDQTHALDDDPRRRSRASDYGVDEVLPDWWRDDDDGVRIVDRD